MPGRRSDPLGEASRNGRSGQLALVSRRPTPSSLPATTHLTSFPCWLVPSTSPFGKYQGPTSHSGSFPGRTHNEGGMIPVGPYRLVKETFEQYM